MKLGSKILAFLTVFVLIFGGYAATPAQATYGQKAKFSVHKTDTASNPLPGAEFKVEINDLGYWRDSGLRMTTDANGNATSAWLTYYWGFQARAVEIDAPNGYVLNGTAGAAVALVNNSTVPLGTFTNTQQGKIKIVKHDSLDTSKVISGAEFDIYKGSVSSGNRVAHDLETGSDGSVTSGWLDPRGDYIVVETDAPSGYQLNDTPITGIAVTSGNVTTVDFNNAPLGRIKIVKHDSEFPGILVSGAEFDIYKGSVHHSNRVAHDLTTGSDGTVTSGWLDPRSDYIVVESDAPDGYQRNNTPITGIAVAGGSVTTVDFNDTRKRYDLLIYKDIEGVCPTHDNAYKDYTFTFQVTNKATGEVFTGSLKGQNFCKITVPYGTYLLEEINIPAGFKFAGFTDGFCSVTEKKVDDCIESVTCHNNRVANLLITKDDGTAKGLVGAKYDIYYSVCEFGPWTLIQNDVLTDASGEYRLSNQVYGYYKVVEVGAPFGYAAPAGGCIVKHLNHINETETAAFHNAQLFGSITVTKEVSKRESDTGAVPGFTVRVTGPSGNPNVASTTADYPIAEGSTTISNLAYGTYTIEEVNLPLGYSNTSLSPASFTIDGDHVSNVVVAIGNTKLYGDITVTKTISNGDAKPGDVFTFDLYSGDALIGTQTITPPATTCIFTGLPYGDYIVRERALAGYAAAADINVTVNEPAESVTCDNTKLYGSIQVNKAFTGATPADGTTFTFRLFHDGAQVGDDKVLTWADGGASVKFEGLEYGYTYHVVEVTKEGYAIDAAFAAPGLAVTITGEVLDKVLTCTNTMLGKIQITKTDKDTEAPLDGAVFTVTPPAGPAFTMTSGAEGVVTSGWLMPGNYTVRETTAPDGYHIDDPAARTVTVTGGGTARETFTDSLGSILIMKRSSYGEKLPVAGVIFQLLNKDPAGSEPASGDIIGTATTNASGIARFDGLMIGHSYWVREIQQAAGYDIDLSLVMRVVPSFEPQAAAAEFENNPLGTIRVTKADSADPGKKLAGAVFGIYSDEACTVLVQTMPATGADGAATSAALPFGGENPAVYYVKEITPPSGYVLNTTAQSVTFTEPGQVAPLTFTNVRNLGSLIIRKVDALELTKVLAGAEFKLYTDEAMTTQVGAAVTTGADGLARFDDLAPGDYWLMETVAPTDYELPTEPLPVTVVAGTIASYDIQNQYNPPEDITTGMMDWNILLLGGLALVAGGLIVLLTRKRKGHATK